MTLDQLKDETFRPLIQQVFTISASAEHKMDVTLIQVNASPHQGTGRRQFSLIFQGPPSPVWKQRIYRIDNPSLGALDVFLCPVSHTPDSTSYEAVFG
jgi:hypothetical protein